MVRKVLNRNKSAFPKQRLQSILGDLLQSFKKTMSLNIRRQVVKVQKISCHKSSKLN